MKLVAVCGAETTSVLCCHLAILLLSFFFSLLALLAVSLPELFSPLQHACVVRARRSHLARRSSCCFRGGVRWISSTVSGGSGMDPRWCPILCAALAVSLSSPAIADRKFGE